MTDAPVERYRVCYSHPDGGEATLITHPEGEFVAYSDYAALSAALSVPAAAVVGEPVAQGPVMMFREGCNYATISGRVCNKCGHLHTDEARGGLTSPEGMREALEKISAMRWHEDADLDDICTIADLALAAPFAPDGWQPIETAPKDGTKILLCLTGYQPVVGYFDGHRWDYQDREDFIEEDHWFAWQEQTGDWYPDHWMPIPAPPAIRSETP